MSYPLRPSLFLHSLLLGVLLVLAIEGHVWAQGLIFRALENQNYAKAELRADRFQEKKPEHPALWYAYARIYSDRQNPGRTDLYQAYQYSRTALEFWRATLLSDQTKYTEKFGVSLKAIVQLRDSLIWRDFRRVNEFQNIDTLEAFQARYQDETWIVKEAQDRIHQLAYEEALRVNTVMGFEAYMETYPKANADQYRTIFIRWDAKVYALETASDTYEAYRAFLRKYCERRPYRLASNFCGEAQAKFDLRLYQWYLAQRSVLQWETYLREYPQAPYRKQAQEQLFTLYFAENDRAELDALEAFVQRFPKHPRVNELWRDMMAIWLVDDDLTTVRKMKEHYHGYVGAPLQALSNEEELLNDFNLSIRDLTVAMPQDLEALYEAQLTNIAPREPAYIALLRMVEGLLVDGRRADAALVLQAHARQFADNAGRAQRLQRLISMLLAAPDTLTMTYLQPPGFVLADDYLPVPTADGQTLYFVHRRTMDSVVQEDIYYLPREGQQWGAAVPLSDSVNTHRNEGLMGISPDGNTLLMWLDEQGNGDIYKVDRTETGWGPLQRLPSPVNSNSFEGDASLVNGGQAILFASAREGNVGHVHLYGEPFHGGHWGNLDLWVTERQPNGQWGPPINLGATLNTPFAERSPFLHADGETLFFSSDGHYGLGRLDVFMSKRLSDSSWTEWSEPVNLGTILNTPGEDWGYKVSTDGQTIYGSRLLISDSLNQYDLFEADLPKQLRPETVVVVNGEVRDQ
ncbi:MAG TPA: hypothetical protein DCP28_07485, partial [Cytophagales bacterium]|nr:hypothetical protein [Cytophagales bacterium]